MNYYERHIGDYLKDTAHLSLLEHGIYARLMDVYYTREQPLDELQIARLIGARTAAEEKALDAVLAEFFIHSRDGWRQARCDQEIERYQAKVAHNREVGKLGGRPKKTETQMKPTGLSVGSESEPEHNPLQSPVSSLQKREEEKARKRATPRPEDVCEQVWSDWTALRKAKRSTVSDTAVSQARSEAQKAGVTLERFLSIWCARGSQGLEASWLKADERNNSAETTYQRSMRERVAEIHPLLARAAPGQSQPNPMEVLDGLTRIAR